MKNAKYGPGVSDIGIERLIQLGTFEDAFPLHDGDADISKVSGIFRYTNEAKCSNEIVEDLAQDYFPSKQSEAFSLRRLLRKSWADFKCAFCVQPLEQVLFYFGAKTAIYFAWLGFYTKMLVLPSLVGLFVFLKGVIGFGGLGWINDNPVAQQMCNDSRLICPRCDGPAKGCPFVEIKESCGNVKLTSIVDNSWTVFYALLIAVWAQIFCALWKRKQKILTDLWNLRDEPAEAIRVEFDQCAKEMTLSNANKIDRFMEKFFPIKKENGSYKVPYVRKLPYIMLSISTIFTLGSIAISCVLGVIMYRLSMATILSSLDTYELITDNAVLIASATSVLVNVACNEALGAAFGSLAKHLTDWELPRTDDDYEKSYTLKMFTFSAINLYASIFYIAFIKGRGTGTPLEYTRFGGKGTIRLEECHPSGCLFDLTMQLAIIMIVKQAIGNVKELGIPFVKGYLRSKKQSKSGNEDAAKPHVRDSLLEKNEKFPLFEEYLEMAVQFGFCTIFVAAFPLAPLFALFNNIIEIRLDAFKFVNLSRRIPVEMAKSIGAWEKILEVIAAMALVTNAIVAASTSDMIPKFVYATGYGPCAGDNGYTLLRLMRNECLNGYSEWSLQPVHVSQLDYRSYGEGVTLFDLYNKDQFKNRENSIKFELLVNEKSYLT